MQVANDRVLVTGATGYVGGRLVRPLLERRHRVRCVARHPEHLAGRVPADVEVVGGDCLDLDSLGPALRGVDRAYYLVHSMGSTGNFVDEDRVAARNFAVAAKEAGVRKIIYLGGLGDDDRPLSSHLRSRHETGAMLASTGVAVLELRASIVLGSGSLSFELIRALVERLPVMICPSWVETMAQPIAIDDVIAYLLEAIDLPIVGDRIFEIGGADQTSYGGIMREYARQRGLRRLMIPFPVLTPRLSSLWLGLTTPVYARVGRKLIESLRNPTVVRDESAREAFAVRPMGLDRAIARAIANEDREFAETRWTDAISSAGRPRSWGGVRLGTRLVDSREREVAVPTDAAFAPIQAIGGANGWYFANWLWRLRGLIDLVVGGVGMRRGRRNPQTVAVGDALDFWRVEVFEPGRRLRLAAEMKVPGRAWLDFEVRPTATGSVIQQTAVFDPAGLAGLVYWYSVYPLHALVFAGMLDAVAARALDLAPVAPPQAT